MSETGFSSIEEIDAWKKGCRLAVDLFQLTQSSAFEKEWSFRDQIRKSALSIPSNIAEGFERESTPEFKRFLLIAKGSCGELRTQLYIARAANYIGKNEFNKHLNDCVEISSMLAGLIKQLRNKIEQE